MKSFDPRKIEALIYEEIQKFLKNPGIINSPDISQNTPDILFILSSPLSADFMAASGIPSILKDFSCAYTAAETPGIILPSEFSGTPEISCSNENVTDRILEKTRILIVPNPCLNLIAQISLGLTPDFASHLILHFLLRQKPVLGIQNKTSPDLAPRSLQSLIHNYIKVLEDWGVIWIAPEELFDFISNKLEPENPDQGKTSDHPQNPSKKTIVTQQDILDRIKKGEKKWILPENAIVTPLALEIAEKHGFSINRTKSPS